MSQPTEPEDVKLISSLFSPLEERIEKGIGELEEIFGPTDWVSPALFFDRTRYYEREMGWPLHRRFVSFRKLIRPEFLVEAKVMTNALEERSVQQGRRQVNIDPGYVSLERLVLATGKNYTHRVYLSRGIYADLTLVFRRGTFRALEWTYRDYALPETISMFNHMRRRYKDQLRGLEGGDPEEARRPTC
ncbi:MAG: DUF4416 family protein [Deltaproteobacteria bacterium]|nr:DUF4416 family protein [Deltaproteobacteria bacterium]